MEFLWFTIGTLVGCILTLGVFGWLSYKDTSKKEAIQLTPWTLIQAAQREKAAFMEVRK